MGLFDILWEPLSYVLINELSKKQTDVSAECEDSIQFDKDIYRDFILKNPTVNIYPY